ncbi:hypothetical protein J437_LFUL002544 [Ladona fulva]|uniref:Elongator complex protein 2 n=1 Tax=Ladona fulva TaxID=123851 RepID=A0A8K0KVC7_LADFU|nr:hypothetical protein J437_LFUL002544 [Ladona fulva]
MAVETMYTSVACNWSRYSTDWGFNNLICFGACNSVAICDPEKDDYGSITNTLCHHKSMVNSVRWIKSQNDAEETEILSTSCDATACIWRRIEDGTYELVQSLEGHSEDVIVGDGIKSNCLNKDSFVIATASTDSTIKIWTDKKENMLKCIQTIDLLREMCFEIRLNYLPGTSNLLMICANTDCRICLYAKSDDLFIKVNELQGHEDFVRTIDVISFGVAQHTYKNNCRTMFIASGDQAGQIRIWQLSSQNLRTQETNSKMDDFKPEVNFFSFITDDKEHEFAISIESVILAHDGMINGIRWHPKVKTENGFHQPMKILSCSMDKTMILWEPDIQSGVWLESIRVGEVGGNSLGFFGCSFGPQGKNILAYGKQGSFHLWSFNQVCKSRKRKWEPKLSVSGHFQGVVDIAWEPEGEFLLSVSCDQTTRIHAPWRRSNGKGLFYFTKLNKKE